MDDNRLGFPALSIRQPWADYVVLGLKDVENRSKPTNFRGTILIHASRTIDYDVGVEEKEEKALAQAGLWGKGAEGYLPMTGAIIGMVDIVDCVAGHDSYYFEEGKFSWVLERPVLFEKPIECKGKVGIFYVPREFLAGTPAATAKAGEIDPGALEKKIKELEALAQKGDAGDKFELALNYAARGRHREAMIWYRRAAEAGESASQNNLGIIYLEGLGCDKNAGEAAKWFRLAAEQGDAWGQYNLALLLRTGEGIELNLEEAVHWLKLAAEQGRASAKNDLGAMYANGDGIVRDLVAAATLFVEAAKGGNKYADTNLEGILKELTALAESGDKPAQKALGEAYLNGVGVDQNVELGQKWLGGWVH